MADLKRLSKFISLMLRHEPDTFGLILDEQGFTDLDAVWAQVQKRYGTTYNRDDLDTMLHDTEGGRQRFEIVDGRIRAMYGHSAVPVTYPPVVPPDVLYHGTTPQAAALIRKEGLNAQARQYVHLSAGIERAQNVATRHGKPVILRIRALDAHNDGVVFHNPEPQHYLVKSVPPEYIEFP